MKSVYLLCISTQRLFNKSKQSDSSYIFIMLVNAKNVLQSACVMLLTAVCTATCKSVATRLSYSGAFNNNFILLKALSTGLKSGL